MLLVYRIFFLTVMTDITVWRCRDRFGYISILVLKLETITMWLERISISSELVFFFLLCLLISSVLLPWPGNLSQSQWEDWGDRGACRRSYNQVFFFFCCCAFTCDAWNRSATKLKCANHVKGGGVPRLFKMLSDVIKLSNLQFFV